MFTSNQPFGPRKPYAAAYQDVGTSTAIDAATPHRLVSLLYATLLGEIARARGAIARGDIAEKGRAIGKAVRILDEGLKAPLNMQGGGAIALNLHDLYDYMLQRLTLANLRSDDHMLAECAELAETLREGWDGMGEQREVACAVAA